VNASRQHEFADRIQQADGVLSWEFFPDSSDLSVRNGNIRQISIGGSNDSSVSNNRIEGHAGLPNGNKTEIMLHWRPLVLNNDLPGTPAVEKGTSHAIRYHPQPRHFDRTHRGTHAPSREGRV